MKIPINEKEAKELFKNSDNLDGLSSIALAISQRKFGKKIDFYAPSFIKYDIGDFKNKEEDFPAISITGRDCTLNCDHCRKNLLKTMIPAQTPEQLLTICRELEKRGAGGCLISGGADASGRVPLKNFMDAIKQIKEETKLTLAVHTGLVDEETAFGLSRAKIDIALIDVIGDKETLKNVYHLNSEVEDFEKSLKYLKNFNVKIAPHVVIGLNYGKISGEFHALGILQKFNPDALVMVSMMPLKSTPMYDVASPSPENIVKILAIARVMFPETPIILGCARDRRHKSTVDRLAVRTGVNAIAHPSREGILEAEKMSLKINFRPACCAEYILSSQGHNQHP